MGREMYKKIGLFADGDCIVATKSVESWHMKGLRYLRWR